MTQRTIWGFEVETSPKGKNIWPYDLKREVVRRVLDDHQHKQMNSNCTGSI